jgi:uncharacterized membrane protein
MNSPTIVLALRLIHIVGGVFWVGGALFLAAFLIPAVRAAGPAGAPVMSQVVQVRRLPEYMMAAAILTVLAGLALYWRNSAGFLGAWSHTGPGIVFSIGALLGLVGLGVGMSVLAPTGRRLGVLATAAQTRGGLPSPDQAAETERLHLRLANASNWVAVLLVLATAAMAIARYAP